MAKALASVSIEGHGVVLYSCTLDSGQAFDGSANFTIPANLTAAMANTFVRNAIITQTQQMFGVTLATTDIILSGGAV